MFLKKGKRKGLIKKGLVSLLAAITFATSCPVSAGVSTISTDSKVDDSTVDFVLLLDCSGTMNQNDKEGWTAAATKSFIDFIGESNTRLSVITFGYDYGSEAYPVGQSDFNSRNRVKEAFPLQEVTQSGKKAAKEAVTKETGRDTTTVATWTPIGYALKAATEILKDGKSADNHAAIVVLSDGLVEGQTDYVDKKTKKDYKSIDKACKTAEEHGWAIYAMELNYQNKGEGKHVMREVLPGTYGNTTTKAYEVQSASKATKKLQEIYTSYFNTELVEVTDGKFTVEEMTAEETLVLSGEVSKITSLELISPSGVSEIYKYSDGDVYNDDRRITFDETTATAKLIMPEEGQWTLKIDGQEKVTLDLEISAISLKEMNLVLNAKNAKDGDSLNNKATVEFEAYFEYNGIRYESDTFYKNYPAQLKCGNKSITMSYSDKGYTGSCQFNDKGSYVVQAIVESNIFREGSRVSGSFSFNVDNDITEAVGEIPVLTCGVNESTETIDLNEYFKDSDPLTFSVKKQTSDDEYEYDLSSDGNLVLKAGPVSDDFDLTVYANDGSGEADVPQTISFKVVNQPIQLIGEDMLNLELTPGDQETIVYSDYFVDPDGTSPDVRIVVEEADESVTIDDSVDGQLTIGSTGSGTAKMTIAAIDGNTDSVMQFILVDVTAMSGVAAFIHNFKILIIIGSILLIVLLALMILMLTGKKIFGEWAVECNGKYDGEVTFSQYKTGKKAVAGLNRLLMDSGYDGDFPRVELVAGNRFNKKVFIRNLNGMDSVILDGNSLDNYSGKGFKIELKPQHTITLNRDGSSVTLSRNKM